MEIFSEDYIKQSYRYLIASLVEHTNSLQLSDEDKTDIMNTMFNVIINTLQPSYAIMYLDQITNIVGGIQLQQQIEKQEAFDIIQQAMKGKE
jgi:hypothetical protein